MGFSIASTQAILKRFESIGLITRNLDKRVIILSQKLDEIVYFNKFNSE
jgi:hypothetical protein